MNKIPVGRSIAFAYAFLFHEIGAVIGLTWFPALVYALSDAATRLLVETGAAASSAEEMEMLARNAPVLIAAFLAMIVARAAAATGVTRQTLGLRAGGALFYFPADRTGLRMFAAFARFVLAVLVLLVFAAVVTVIAFLLAGVPLNNPEQLEPSAASLIASLLSLSLVAYAVVTAVRMAFLLPAVVVAEEKGGLKRAHALLQGNFLRMLAVLVALGLPILVLFVGGEFVVMSAALGPDFLDNPDMQAVMQQAEAAIRQQIVAWEIFNAVLFVLGSGLVYSGAAYAYRALAPEAEKPRT